MLERTSRYVSGKGQILRKLLRPNVLHATFQRDFSIRACLGQKIQLRDYQKEAITNVSDAIRRGIRRPAVVLATGGGKTVVFSHLIPQIQPSSPTRGNKTLVLAHKEELIYQAANSIRKINPDLKIDIDMRKLKPSADADVIVASIPTLVRKSRLEWYNPLDFKTIILDECHHATASSWTKILAHFEADSANSEIYVIGFTATMERSDGQSLGKVFDEIVFERGLLTMVRNKELADVKFSCVDVDVDLSQVATKRDDYDVSSLSQAINTDEVNLLVAMSYIQLRNRFGFKSTLMFCVDIAHCKTLCGVLQRHGVNAQYVTGDTAKHERAAIIEDFKNGVIQVLCNVLVFTEGTDIPSIDSLFLARPTKSRPLLVQMIGRGLRLHNLKTHCHVVDIAGTRGTGIQSVPTLFSLPPDYVIHGKTYQELSKEKDEYELEQEILKAEEAAKKEKLRREEELATHKRMTELQDEMNLKFTTFDGFMSLESEGAKSFESQKSIHDTVRQSSIPWVRLEYDLWGHNCNEESFFLLKREIDPKDEDKTSFSLTVAQFNSAYFRKLSGFKAPKIIRESVLEKSDNLKTVITKAESLLPTMVPPYKRLFRQSPVTDKQVKYIVEKLHKKATHYHGDSPDIKDQMIKAVSAFDRERASKLIFALKYSTRSLWIRWELQKILGPDKRSQRAIKKIMTKHSSKDKSSSLSQAMVE